MFYTCRDIAFSDERYVLNWTGKSDVFRLLQEMIDYMIDAVIAVYPNKVIAFL